MNGNLLNDFAAWLAPHLPLAVLVVSLLLAVGGIAIALVHSPAHRQRVGELTIAAALGWLVLAAIPLPRWLPAHEDAANVNTSDSVQKPHAHIPLGHDSTADFEASLPTIQAVNVAPARPSNADAALPIVEEQFTLSDGGSANEPAVIAGLPLSADTAEINSAANNSIARDSKSHKLDSAGVSPQIDRAIVATATASRRNATSGWIHAVSIAYLISIVVSAFWLVLGHALLLRERFTAAAPPAWLYRLLHSAVESWEGRLPRLVVSRRSARPLSWGVWRPIICLPEQICHTANRDQLRTILLHELGHIRRGDARGNLLFELAFPLLFVHPLYWWLRAQVRMAAELVADDWAAGQTGKEVYVAQLVALARGSGRRQLLSAGTGVFSSPSQFYRRMHMLLAREKPLATRLSRFWRITSAAGLAAAVALGAALAGNRPAAGQQKDQPAKEAPKSVSTEAPKAESAAAPKLPGADAPKTATAPVALEAAPAAAAGALPAAKDVPAASVSAGPAPVATALAAAEPAAGLPSGPAVAPLATTPAAAEPAVGLPSGPAVGQPAALPAETTPASAGSSSDDAATAARLRTEKAKLLDEIQALRAKLHELDAAGKMGAGSGPMAAPAAVPPSADPLISQGRVVILNRADENGHIYQEAWTTDANGKPSKIVKRSEVPGDSPITAATAGMSDGKRVVKMFKGKNGPVWIHTYDAESGKLIETREANAAETASVTPGSVDPTRANPTPNVDQAPDQSPGPSISVRRGQPETAQFPAKYPPAFVAVPGSDAPPEVKVWNEKNGPGPVLIARTADGAAANVSDRPIDLITLATSYADAVGAVELAKAKLAEAESGGQTGELRSRRAALENAVRKEKLLRRIAEVATAGAKQNYERLVKLHGQGVVSADMLDESKSRLDILSQILDTRGDTPAESNSAQPK